MQMRHPTYFFPMACLRFQHFIGTNRAFAILEENTIGEFRRALLPRLGEQPGARV